MSSPIIEFWPEHKVYLFGQVTFLPQQIENVGMRKQKIRKFFHPLDSPDILEKQIDNYEKQGYFQSYTSKDTDGTTLYHLSNIDRERITDELTSYLRSIINQIGGEATNQIIASAAMQKDNRGYSPIVSWRDLYGFTAQYNYHPPFWENIFSLALDRRISIESMDYTRIMPYFLKDEGLQPIPDEMLDFYIRPFAGLTILDPVMKKKIQSKNSKAEYKVTLSLKGKKLRGQISNRSYVLHKYQSENSNNYRALQSLMSKPQHALSLSELNLKTNAKTAVKQLPANMGFSGPLNTYFITRGDRPPSLMLHKTIYVTELDLKEIQSDFAKRDKENQ